MSRHTGYKNKISKGESSSSLCEVKQEEKFDENKRVGNDGVEDVHVIPSVLLSNGINDGTIISNVELKQKIKEELSDSTEGDQAKENSREFVYQFHLIGNTVNAHEILEPDQKSDDSDGDRCAVQIDVQDSDCEYQRSLIDPTSSQHYENSSSGLSNVISAEVQKTDLHDNNTSLADQNTTSYSPRRFKYSVCEKRSVKKEHLRSHELIHTESSAKKSVLFCYNQFKRIFTTTCSQLAAHSQLVVVSLIFCCFGGVAGSTPIRFVNNSLVYDCVSYNLVLDASTQHYLLVDHSAKVILTIASLFTYYFCLYICPYAYIETRVCAPDHRKKDLWFVANRLVWYIYVTTLFLYVKMVIYLHAFSLNKGDLRGWYVSCQIILVILPPCLTALIHSGGYFEHCYFMVVTIPLTFLLIIAVWFDLSSDVTNMYTFSILCSFMSVIIIVDCIRFIYIFLISRILTKLGLLPW